MAIFSTEEKVTTFNDKKLRGTWVPEKYTWDELVDQFGESYDNVIIDPEKTVGLYEEIPLRKA